MDFGPALNPLFGQKGPELLNRELIRTNVIDSPKTNADSREHRAFARIGDLTKNNTKAEPFWSLSRQTLPYEPPRTSQGKCS